MPVVRQKAYKELAEPSPPQEVKQENFPMMKSKVSLAPARLAVWGAGQCETEHSHSLEETEARTWPWKE